MKLKIFEFFNHNSNNYVYINEYLKLKYIFNKH